MKFPVNYFTDNIQERKVYYFSSTYLNTNTPHYFICIKKTDDEVIILSCCTSQFETVKRFVETRSLPYETLVYISSNDSINEVFDKDTYVNCNEYYQYTVDDFRKKYEEGLIVFSGEISESHYEQILTGFHTSPMISPEIKELLPLPGSK